MNAGKFEKFLISKDACYEGLSWVKGKSLKQTWMELERPDWMMWLYMKSKKIDKKKCVMIAVFSAESCLDKFESKYPDDKRPREAIEAAKNWIKKPSAESAESAARAARAAYWGAESAESAARAAYWGAESAASAASAESAARAAYWSAESAESAASAARAAYWSAESAASAAYWRAESAESAARAENKKTCDYIRSIIKSVKL